MTVASSARASSSPSPAELQLGQPDQLALVARVAHGEHDRHRLRQQAARDEPEDLSRGGVEPLRVVDEAEQRPFLGDVGQQAQRGQRDQEAGGVAGLEAEGHSQGDLLRLGQRVEPPEHRRAEPVQPGERQLHLGLDPRDLRDPEARGLAGAVAQERRLADAGLTPHRPAPRSGRPARCPAADRAAHARRYGPGTPAGGGRPWDCQRKRPGITPGNPRARRPAIGAKVRRGGATDRLAVRVRRGDRHGRLTRSGPRDRPAAGRPRLRGRRRVRARPGRRPRPPSRRSSRRTARRSPFAPTSPTSSTSRVCSTRPRPRSERSTCSSMPRCAAARS